MSGFSLKIFAIILMVVDHIGYFNPTDTPIILRIIGRLVAPIFFFLLVEGYKYTRSRKKYILNLFSFGFLLSVINLVAIIIKPSLLNIGYSPISPNIFLSLGFCLSLVFIKDKILAEENISIKISFAVLFILVFILNLYTEAGLLGFFMTFIFNLVDYNEKFKFSFIYVFGSIIFCYLTKNVIQVFMIFSILPLLFYNGKRGLNNIYIKYFFYIFYPVHFIIFILFY